MVLWRACGFSLSGHCGSESHHVTQYTKYGAANQATEAEVAGLVTVLQEALAEL